MGMQAGPAYWTSGDGTGTGIQVFIVDFSAWEHRAAHADNGISSLKKSRSRLASPNFLSAYETERNSKLFDSVRLLSWLRSLR